MYTIGIDTSHRFLLIVLMDDNSTIDFVKFECLKQQSEYIIAELDKLLKRNALEIEQVKQLVVTLGPGSYTGVRIALTVAKVLGGIAGIQVYSLSTLQLYAGLKDCYVLMDARAKRVYIGKYQAGQAVIADKVMFNEEVKTLIDQATDCFMGDMSLFGQQDNYQSIENNFMALKSKWQKVENIDSLSPVYLKTNEAYLKND